MLPNLSSSNAAASILPPTDTNVEIRALQTQIQSLGAENAALQAYVAKEQAENAALQAYAAQAQQDAAEQSQAALQATTMAITIVEENNRLQLENDHLKQKQQEMQAVLQSLIEKNQDLDQLCQQLSQELAEKTDALNEVNAAFVRLSIRNSPPNAFTRTLSQSPPIGSWSSTPSHSSLSPSVAALTFSPLQQQPGSTTASPPDAFDPLDLPLDNNDNRYPNNTLFDPYGNFM